MRDLPDINHLLKVSVFRKFQSAEYEELKAEYVKRLQTVSGQSEQYNENYFD